MWVKQRLLHDLGAGRTFASRRCVTDSALIRPSLLHSPQCQAKAACLILARWGLLWAFIGHPLDLVANGARAVSRLLLCSSIHTYTNKPNVI